MGCVRTDTPDLIQQEFQEILDGFTEEPFFWELLKKIEEQGIHATSNHPDVRTAFYKKLPFMNFRSYFVMLDKRDQFYKDLVAAKPVHEIYTWMVRKLVVDRVRNNSDENVFYFEEYKLEKRSQRIVLTEIFSEMDKSNTRFEIVTKEALNIGLVDYMNFVIYSLFKDLTKQEKRVIFNFNMLSPKIAILIILNTKTFFNRSNKIELSKINKILAGEQP